MILAAAILTSLVAILVALGFRLNDDSPMYKVLHWVWLVANLQALLALLLTAAGAAWFDRGVFIASLVATLFVALGTVAPVLFFIFTNVRDAFSVFNVYYSSLVFTILATSPVWSTFALAARGRWPQTRR